MSWTEQTEDAGSWSEQTTRTLVRVTESGVVRVTEDGRVRCAVVSKGHVWGEQGENSDIWTVQ